MAVVRGVKEKVHLPLYDARKFAGGTTATPGRTIQQQISGNLLKFFVDVQNKTKLETNQQESGVLSHFNTYEARALRVILQPIPGLSTTSGQDDRDFIANFIYNSVTTFIVGEKIMIQAPTWMFPSGAGEANDGRFSHGIASPEATFRFAEPIHIDSQQNFRVEIEFPNGVVALGGAKIADVTTDPGDEIRVWVLLDGYITRDVQ